MLEVIRRVYDVPEGKNDTTDHLVRALKAYLATLEAFESSLEPIQREDEGISLKLADRDQGRKRLKAFLDLVGFRLRKVKKAYRVVPDDDRSALGRRALLHDVGVNVDDLGGRLNQGESVTIEIPTVAVPLPLSPKTWADVVFERPVPRAQLFGAILGDRKAALLYHGLASLDQPTLAFLEAHPDLLGRLYRDHAAVIATLGRSLRVREDQIVVPGGNAARALWERFVDEKVDEPEKFIRKVLSHDNGRLAYFYDCIAHLDAPRLAFVLGPGSAPLDDRRDRVRALYSSFVGGDDHWNIEVRPFSRPAIDPALLLMQVGATEDGTMAPPAWKRFWDRVFDGRDLPDNPEGDLRDLKGEGFVEPGWLADHLTSVLPEERRVRLDAVLLAQRVFGSTAESALPDVLTALRALRNYRVLMLTLERMGVRDPAVYAEAARTAARLSAIDDKARSPIALAQFQGALALVERAAFARTIDGETAARLAHSLARVPLNDGRYLGGVGAWLDRELMPAGDATFEALRGGSTETTTAENADEEVIALRLIAGMPTGQGEGALGRRQDQREIEWEGTWYRLDHAATEFNHLRRLRRLQAGNSLTSVLAYARTVASLSTPTPTLDAIQRAVQQLKTASATLTQPQASGRPDDPDLPRIKEVTDKAVKDLLKIKKDKDTDRAIRIARPLAWMSDVLIADVLANLTYASAIKDPDAPMAKSPATVRRHDFGLSEPTGDRRARLPWSMGFEDVSSGPAHVKGSMLALDLALAPTALWRLSAEVPPAPPALTTPEQVALAQGVVLLNPRDLDDESGDAIATALRRGRERIKAALDPVALDEVARTAGLSEWRRAVLPWLLTNDPTGVALLFSPSEMWRLGTAALGGSAETVPPYAWGTVALPLSGCYCLAFPDAQGWESFEGRAGTGILAARTVDLNLAVAAWLSELHLPAALAPGVLGGALQSLIDESQPLHPDDWLTLAQYALSLTRGRLEDYVAALTARGPLAAAPLP